ncbi:DMT family transporter [Halalkalibacter urbisdiaboli]|uniref:DMT family transporter n=1 Tax=Halalkalibacter urbisdiaboli TaxID=1960589 RepID=UPI000B4406EA|nr:DMT family transporter [Halalkalibacter urbisdiaboli]
MKNNFEVKHLDSPQIKLKQKMIPYTFVLMWSSGAIFVTFGLKYADPFIFLFLRLLFSTLVLWGVVFFLNTGIPTKSTEWGYILLTGLCMQAGYQIFYFLALDNQISPGVLAIFLGIQPIITTFFIKVDSGKTQWLGLIFGIIGLILVVADNIIINSFNFMGISSALLSLFSITIGTILQKNIKISQPSNMAIQYSGATFILLLLVLTFDQSFKWTSMFTLSLAWMVLIISVGATLLLYQMIQKGNLMNVTSLFYSVPPVTALLDYFFFGNSLELITVIGMIFIVFGLLLVNQKGKFL